MASTVIDELVVQLGLNAEDFVKGQKTLLESLKKAREGVEEEHKKIQGSIGVTAGAFNELSKRALGFTALLIGGHDLESFVSHIITTDANVGRLAKTMDLSARELSIWQTAAHIAGGSAEGITSALGFLTSEIQTFGLTGQSSLLPYLNSLGVGLLNSNGQLKTPTELFKDIAGVLAGIDPARAAVYANVFHMDTATLNMAIRGRLELEGMLVAAGKINVLTEEQVR